jgi:hypothetical protein
MSGAPKGTMEAADVGPKRRDGYRAHHQRWRGRVGNLQGDGVPVGGRAIWNSDPSSPGPAEKGDPMSKATYPLKLPHSIKRAAQRLAKEDGVSLNQWIAAAVAEKVGWSKLPPRLLQKAGGQGNRGGIDEVSSPRTRCRA